MIIKSLSPNLYFFHYHHLTVSYCNDIVRRNSVIATHGCYRVKKCAQKPPTLHTDNKFTMSTSYARVLLTNRGKSCRTWYFHGNKVFKTYRGLNIVFNPFTLKTLLLDTMSRLVSRFLTFNWYFCELCHFITTF